MQNAYLIMFLPGMMVILLCLAYSIGYRRSKRDMLERIIAKEGMSLLQIKKLIAELLSQHDPNYHLRIAEVRDSLQKCDVAMSEVGFTKAVIEKIKRRAERYKRQYPISVPA